MSEKTKKKGPRWIPLESNPDVMNDYIHKLGVSSTWNYEDMFMLDGKLIYLSQLGVPTESKVEDPLAVLILYPVTENNERHRKEEEQRLRTEGKSDPGGLVFYKQTIGNACGTIALLHSLANNTNQINVADGPLKNLLAKTKDVSPEERARILETEEELASVHQASATAGQTQAPSADVKVDLHFTCFVRKNGRLYELDGRKPFPIDHGESESLLEGAAKVIDKLVKMDPTNPRFNAIALVQNQSMIVP